MESEVPNKPAEANFMGVSRVRFRVPFYTLTLEQGTTYNIYNSLKLSWYIILKSYQRYFLQSNSQGILHM